MPGLSGLAALEQVRATNPEVGIIMVTGNGNDVVIADPLEDLSAKFRFLGGFGLTLA